MNNNIQIESFDENAFRINVVNKYNLIIYNHISISLILYPPRSIFLIILLQYYYYTIITCTFFTRFAQPPLLSVSPHVMHFVAFITPITPQIIYTPSARKIAAQHSAAKFIGFNSFSAYVKGSEPWPPTLKVIANY